MGFQVPAQLHGGDARELPSFPFRSVGAPAEEAIGASLENVRTRLLALVAQLTGTLGEHASPLLQEARRQLEQRACRIAVIGQIKAGKTTFINSLIGRPGLLPTDINPWTAVVTALHFRADPNPPEHQAVFQIFSAEEWKQIAVGGGRLRELTERLVPGFQPDLLRAQLEVMRKRAARRWGSKFDQLLGTTHRFKEITPQSLADYVSVGESGADDADTQQPNYSDITRAADLYFNESPFAFPITLVDTPGTNDPFLVRDEITRRSLENPDIYVFVVSALQPLSAADIGMIRLLNGLHKDRIIVFVNRVDQLANPVSDVALIKRAVKKRLKQEFPALHIPVITGSAWREGAGASAGDAGAPETPFQVVGASTATAIPTGMGEVAGAISRMMGGSTIAVLMQQIAGCLLELVRSDQAGVKAELQSIQRLFEAQRAEAGTLQKRVAEEKASLAVFEARAHALHASFDDIRRHFSDTLESGRTMMRDELRNIVRDFAQTSADRMVVAIENGVSTKSWRCNVAPLRSDLEAVYLAAFEQIAGDVVHVEEILYPHLQVIVGNLLPDYHGSGLEAPQANMSDALSLSPLADKVTMDLETQWWTHWLKRRPAHERANELRDLIEDDFLPIVDQLVSEAVQVLEERIAYTMQRANAITSGLISGIEQRKANLAAQAAPLNGGDGREETHGARIQACVERQVVLGSSQEELRALLTELTALQADDERQ